MLVVNLAAVFGQGQPSPRLSLYIDAADEAAMERIASRVEDDPDVDTVVLIGRDVALDELLRTGGLEELRGHLGPNPLPDMIEVHPRAGLDSTDYEVLAARFAAIDGVGDVQVDLEWVSRLRALTDLALVVVRAFWVLLFAGVAMVIANSVRLSLVTARDEVEVISPVGGSDAFIRRPYLYLGLLYGVGGGRPGRGCRPGRACHVGRSARQAAGGLPRRVAGPLRRRRRAGRRGGGGGGDRLAHFVDHRFALSRRDTAPLN
ncbi:MAG: permease-like cell division protein FtsX [Gammaproteobacteria bacterium]|nr:permease-like cell division protein FtsX [Gammaproteobacteria bacterium]